MSTTLDIDFSCDEPGSLSPTRDTEHEAQRTIGKDIKEEQNRLKGFEVSRSILQMTRKFSLKVVKGIVNSNYKMKIVHPNYNITYRFPYL